MEKSTVEAWQSALSVPEMHLTWLQLSKCLKRHL